MSTAPPDRRRFLLQSAVTLGACALDSPGAGWAADDDASVRDVVIYGGTSAGVAAAVQAARMGKSVVLIEPSRHLGGLTSGGLGMTDSGNKAVIGGIAREFYQRVKKHYLRPESWKFQKPEDYKWLSETGDALFRFEPRIAEQIFRAMLAEVKVPIVLGERLDLKNGVTKEGKAITAIRMESGRTFRGRRFIDATYEGDLMAGAGVRWTIGREANAQYGETLNGVQVRNATKHQFLHDVDPYVVPGDPKSGLLPGLHAGPPGEEGAADQRIQAYCFRMCLTDVPANRVPFPKPEGYDPKRHELYLRYILKGWRDVWGNHQMMPNRKSDTNNHGAFSTDNIGMNYDYPAGDYATREKIIKEHETYQKGLFWFLVNDPRVPEDLRKKISPWGLARDEFTDNDHWPHQIYVREARRMVSDHVQTEHDCRRTRRTPESVGMGSYNMDSHNVQRYVDARGFARNEGDIQVSPGGPYMISYQAIRPRTAECTNLLVPVCLSSSHIAYGSIRMEPVFMVLGQSAATAACLSLDDQVTVQEVRYDRLRARLLQDKQVLEYAAPPRPPGQGSVDPRKLPGIVVDDTEARVTGEWRRSSAAAGHVGAGYLHDGNEGQGKKSVHYEVRLPRDGTYEVRLAYTALANRATNVPVVVRHAQGETRVVVNQRKTPAVEGMFASLGRFSFTAKDAASVTISNTGTDGYVIADAVQFLPVP